MKKLFTLTLCILLSTFFAGCSAQENPQASQDNQAPNSSQVEPNINNVDVVYGKIDSIAGNSISVSLGSLPLPEDYEQPESDGTAAVITGTVITVPAGSAEDDGDIEIPQDFEMPEVELEYNGQQQEFTIPAGAGIVNNIGAQVKLDALKKGSVIQMILDSTTQTVTSIIILG